MRALALLLSGEATLRAGFHTVLGVVSQVLAGLLDARRSVVIPD